MLEWLSRETAIDASINLAPVAILAYFALLFEVLSPWEFELLPVVMTHTLTIFPLILLAFVTYLAARLIERDASRS